MAGATLARLVVRADLFGKRGRRGYGADRRGIAALELALAAPVLLAVLAPLADFTLALSDRGQLAAAVEAGADYAFNQGQVLAGTQQYVSANDVKKALTGTSLAATATVTGPGTYCVSGTAR